VRNALACAQRAALCAGLLLLGSADALAADADAFQVGVTTHFAHGDGRPEEVLSVLKESRATSFRDDILWRDVEREKGVLRFDQLAPGVERAVDRAARLGVEPLLVFSYGNRFYDDARRPTTDAAQDAYVRFCEAVVRHYKGRVRYYEVWNEWNGEGGDPKAYGRLLKKVYAAVKRVDHDAVVLGGAVEGAGDYKWVDAMVAEAGLDAMDGLSVHPYVWWRGETGTPEALLEWVQGQQRSLHKHSGGKDFPIYLTELGWPTHTGVRGVTPARAADYLARSVLALRTLPYVKGVWWYGLRDDGADPNVDAHNFGLVTVGNVLKPAYRALRDAVEIASKSSFLGRVPSDPGLWAVRFRLPEGGDALALWHARSSGLWRVNVEVTGEPVTVRFVKIGSVSQPQQSKLQAGQNALQLSIDSTPLIVAADGGHFEVKGIVETR
jgi:polysaccharide biosynthesis protein PslG